MHRRLASLLLTVGLVAGTAGAQAPAPTEAPARATPTAPSEAPVKATPTAPSEAPVRATPPAPARSTRPQATPRKPAAEPATPAVAPAAPVPASVQAVEYTFLRREDPEADLAQLQQLGAEGWQVVATVEVDGSTRRYVLMRPKR